MSWNFKLSEADFKEAWSQMIATADKLIGYRMYKYFELMEPMTIPNLVKKLMEADWAGVAEANYEKVLKAGEEYLEGLKEASRRVSRELYASEIKRIHVLKGEARISEEEYRTLIERISGKQSSKDMLYWEGMILMRALTRIKERTR